MRAAGEIIGRRSAVFSGITGRPYGILDKDDAHSLSSVGSRQGVEELLEEVVCEPKTREVVPHSQRSHETLRAALRVPLPGEEIVTSQVRSFLASRFELPHSSGRIVPFEGLRGFAILLVFFVHFGALFGKRLEAGTFLSRATAFAEGMGHAGVEVFFFLSGFLIYGIVMRDRFQLGSYLSRRFWRLYPTFLTVTAAILAVYWIFPQASKLPSIALGKSLYILSNLAMLPGVFDIEPLTAPAWSLSYEMVFYVTLPLIIAALGIRRWAWWHRIVFFVSLAAIHALLNVVGVDGKVRFIMFAAGISLCEISRNCQPAEKLNSWGESAAILAFAANLAAIGIAFSGVVPTTLAWGSVQPFIVRYGILSGAARGLLRRDP